MCESHSHTGLIALLAKAGLEDNILPA